MKKVSFDAEVVYRVSLTDVEVDDEIAGLLEEQEGEVLDPAEVIGKQSKVLDFAIDKVNENDACDWTVTLENIEIK